MIKQVSWTLVLVGGLATAIVFPWSSDDRPSCNVFADEAALGDRSHLQMASKFHHEGKFRQALDALEAVPSNQRLRSEAAFTIHGDSLLQMGVPLAAIGVFSEGLTQFPDSSRFLAGRGVARWLCGEYCAGVEEMSLAITTRSGDVGNSYDTLQVFRVPDEALRHADIQMSAMLRDLPIMDNATLDGGWLRDWCLRQFAGEATGFQIDWSSKRPTFADAAHSRPENGLRATVKLSPVRIGSKPFGKSFSGEELWAKLVYEFHNIQNTRDGEFLNQRAKRGEVSRTEYVMKSLEMELRAIQRTRAFYVRYFLPHALATCVTTDPRVWYLDRWDTIANYKVRSANPKGYPFLPFGSHYDWIRVRSLQEKNNHDDAIGLLRQMCRYADTTDSGVAVWAALANACYAAGRNQEGVDAAEDGLTVHPRSVPLLRVRAYGLVQLGDLPAAQKVVSELLSIDAKDEYALQVRQAINNAAVGTSARN